MDAKMVAIAKTKNSFNAGQPVYSHGNKTPLCIEMIAKATFLIVYQPPYRLRCWTLNR